LQVDRRSSPASFLNSLSVFDCTLLVSSVRQLIQGSNADHSLSEQGQSQLAVPLEVPHRVNTHLIALLQPQDNNRATQSVNRRRHHACRSIFTSFVHGTGGVRSLLSVFLAVKHTATTSIHHQPRNTSTRDHQRHHKSQVFDTLNFSSGTPSASNASRWRLT
jgi:hypothetical protein